MINNPIQAVAKQSSLTQVMANHWPMLDALMGGTLAMRQASRQLLPKWPAENEKDYAARLSVSVLYPAFSRTAKVMAAKPFSTEGVDIEDMPSQIEILKDNCDLLGTDINEFFADRMLDCLSHGLVGVLVDYNSTAPALTVAEEKATGSRPYFKAYKCSAILGFKLFNNELSQIRLLEKVCIDDGDFLEKEVEQVRVLRVGSWELYRKNDKAEWFLFDGGVSTMKKIPFVFFYGTKLGFGHGVSPLLDLAYQNVEHWQSSSDQQNILHVARVPILWASGIDESEDIVFSASVAAKSSNPGATLEWVEHSGAAIGAGRESILDLENRMIATGAELIVKRQGNITATQVSSEDKANSSILQNITEEFEDGVAQCISLAAQQVNIDYLPEIELFKNFCPNSLETVQAILQAQTQLIITTAEARIELAAKGVFSEIDAEASPPTKMEI